MTDGRWSDLTTRITSAAVLVAIGAIEVWLGGLWFETFIAVACGLMVWELVRMVAPDRAGNAIGLALLSAVAVLVSYHVPVIAALPILLAPALVGAGQMPDNRAIYGAYAAWITLAGYGFISIRETMGFDWMLWLVCVVVATDVAGYFCGKALGGPKFWPRVSPKKTWSGTAGGWVAAGLVGICFAIYSSFGAGFVAISVAASMASQAGDIAESALKRRMGVKDSSNLIPGHGGFLDRFDGMMGASIFILIASFVYSAGTG